MADEDTEAFAPEGAEQRERIRVELHESAVAMQRARISGDTVKAKPSLDERVKALGFEDEAVKVFDLLPLVHVAWADGAIQAGERATILNLLQIRGIGAGKAYTTMEALLEKKPSKPYLDESLDVLRDFVKERPDAAKTIVGLCVLIAESAGGFLGLFGKVSKEERGMIEEVAKRLGDDAVAEFQRQLG